MTDAGQQRGLLIDWGGVLTINIWHAYDTFCRAEEVDPAGFVRLMTDPVTRQMVYDFECGRITEEVFGDRLCGIVGVTADRMPGFLDRLTGSLLVDEPMVAAVRAVRAAGVHTSLVSNSWTLSAYPRDLLAELFDDVLLSGELGIRKPDPEIYQLAVERSGLPAAACVFVDDFTENVAAAHALGMTAVHHTAPAATITELERLLGVPLTTPNGH